MEGIDINYELWMYSLKEILKQSLLKIKSWLTGWQKNKLGLTTEETGILSLNSDTDIRHYVSEPQFPHLYSHDDTSSRYFIELWEDQRPSIWNSSVKCQKI